ncbi:phosphoribosyltransferase [Lacrimispora amygdalina]|uniref:phosphoribosyltransferase n=1 Tax=Lacrimispora amygdalina TaxID=253257 RepID=UPI000BE2A4B9|nr:phosphoribosyltransferase [Lacrimispora amygdalina]
MNITEFLDLLNQIVLLILGLSTIAGILDYVGFLPKWLRGKLRLNRNDDTLSLLRELGVNIDQQKRMNQFISFPRDLHQQSLEETTNEALKRYTIKKNIAIGHNRFTEVDYYIDLIGATCDSEIAIYFARLLSTYWSITSFNGNDIKNSEFDFVVSPKGGSPILGYEFAKLIGKQFIIHEEKERFRNHTDDFRSKFNCKSIPEKGKVALIVDDSTTGGMMVIETIKDLKKFGYNIYSCFVVFEPQHKDARQKLAQQGVQLVSIVKTHSKRS